MPGKKAAIIAITLICKQIAKGIYLYRELIVRDTRQCFGLQLVHGLGRDDAMDEGENQRRFRAGLEEADEAAVPTRPAKIVRVQFLLVGELLERRLALQVANGLGVGQDKVLLIHNR